MEFESAYFHRTLRGASKQTETFLGEFQECFKWKYLLVPSLCPLPCDYYFVLLKVLTMPFLLWIWFGSCMVSGG